MLLRRVLTGQNGLKQILGILRKANFIVWREVPDVKVVLYGNSLQFLCSTSGLMKECGQACAISYQTVNFRNAVLQVFKG